MSTRRIAVYLEEELIEDLNRATAASDLSRSELIAAAIRRYLNEARRRELQLRLVDGTVNPSA